MYEDERSQGVVVLALKCFLFSSIIQGNQFFQHEAKILGIETCRHATRAENIGRGDTPPPLQGAVGNVFAVLDAQGVDAAGKVWAGKFDQIAGGIAHQ